MLKIPVMPLTKEKKSSIIGQYGGAETNTGSIEGQVALLTERIAQISAHLQQNKKDFSTHRGLMQLVGKRRRLLSYLQKHNLQGYRELIEKLGLKNLRVGGAKVSTKLAVLGNLVGKVDHLIIGGGMANTFLAARGVDVGKSLCEDDLVPTAKILMDKMVKRNAGIPIAVDVVVGKKFDANEPAILKDADSVSDDDMIFDIGPKSAQELADIIMKAGTVVWNGPVGVFEFDQFGEGTRTVAMAIAETNAFTLAGGGDTIAAIQKYDIYDKVSYISTAGGAFLEFLEGKKLPAVEILEQRAAEKRS